MVFIFRQDTMGICILLRMDLSQLSHVINSPSFRLPPSSSDPDASSPTTTPTTPITPPITPHSDADEKHLSLPDLSQHPLVTQYLWAEASRKHHADGVRQASVTKKTLAPQLTSVLSQYNTNKVELPDGNITTTVRVIKPRLSATDVLLAVTNGLSHKLAISSDMAKSLVNSWIHPTSKTGGSAQTRQVTTITRSYKRKLVLPPDLPPFTPRKKPTYTWKSLQTSLASPLFADQKIVNAMDQKYASPPMSPLTTHLISPTTRGAEIGAFYKSSQLPPKLITKPSTPTSPIPIIAPTASPTSKRSEIGAAALAHFSENQ